MALSSPYLPLATGRTVPSSENARLRIRWSALAPQPTHSNGGC